MLKDYNATVLSVTQEPGRVVPGLVPVWQIALNVHIQLFPGSSGLDQPAGVVPDCQQTVGRPGDMNVAPDFQHFLTSLGIWLGPWRCWWVLMMGLDPQSTQNLHQRSCAMGPLPSVDDWHDRPFMSSAVHWWLDKNWCQRRRCRLPCSCCNYDIQTIDGITLTA